MMFGDINSSGATIDKLQNGDASDILLPNQTGRVQKIAVDIGGSLAKVIYFTASGTPGQGGGRLHFTAFETDNVKKCVEFIKSLLSQTQREEEEELQASTVAMSSSASLSSSVTGDATDESESEPEPLVGSVLSRGPKSGAEDKKPVIRATGGGAHLFRDLLASELGVEIEIEDEMGSLITGLNFLIREVADEVFSYSGDDRPMEFEDLTAENPFPYILVNIGSGVSIIKVTDNKTHERISGTSLGGGTLWGLLHLLTGVRSFDKMLKMTKTGDNTKVDMMVGDIYGTNYDKIGLKATNIASTMAGVYRKSLEKRHCDADIARSLLYAISNNIGQIAYLNARLHNIKRIYFGGYFIRGHPLTMHTLSYAINFWSKGEMRALFLRHEGFLGATGAFMKAEPEPEPELAQEGGSARLEETSRGPRRHRTKSYSFTENFSIAGSIADDSVSSLGMLDHQPSKLGQLPKLVNEPGMEYSPDTVDLTADAEQQSYWIDAMERNTAGLVGLAERGDLNCRPDELPKMHAFNALYNKHLRRLRDRPHAYGPISVRTLLGLREQCLHEVGLTDIFLPIKRRETDDALDALPSLLASIDGIADGRARLRVLLHNVLAGNMFDWGSTELRDMLHGKAMDFDLARDKVARPPRLNNGDEFVDRVVSGNGSGGPRYRRAVVFVDNSGADVCLGVLPFARYLLAAGTKVVLAANSKPALNDVTERELVDVMRRAAKADQVIAAAVAERCVMVCGTGSSGPCLDLRKLDERLVRHSGDADLVVLVGMGRAIHTNYRAQFECDSLKLAVFKNKMAADAAGASIYDAMCLYVPGTAGRRNN